MSKHVHLLIDKNNLVATGDGLTTSNERFISHFLQNGNNGKIISICENCLQYVDNSNQTEEDKMSRMLSWSDNICKRSSNLKLDVSATEVLLNRL